MKKLLSRTLIGIVGIPAVIGLAYLGGWFFTGFIILVSIFAIYELSNMLENIDIKTNRLNTIAASFAILITAGIDPTMLSYVLPLTLIYLFSTIITGNIKNTFQSISTSTFTIIYIPINLSFFLLLRQIPDLGFKLLLIGLVMVWACDSFAYTFGSLFGKIPLASKISPNKSITGAIAGFIGSVLAIYLFHYFNFIKFDLILTLGLGAIVGIFAQTGDIIESVLKRDTGVDDSGKILLGHGGVLDRIDSLLIIAPVIYLYSQIFLV